MNDDTIEGWRRLGNAVRDARLAQGYTSRESFAESANISVRALADLESCARTNFSDRTLTRIEDKLGWKPTTATRIARDNAAAPPPTNSGQQVPFRVGYPGAVAVKAEAAERALTALTKIPVDTATRDAEYLEILDLLGPPLVELCWQYMTRLVENNCVPGAELHPSVRQLYDNFYTVATRFCTPDPSGSYTQWLCQRRVKIDQWATNEN